MPKSLADGHQKFTLLVASPNVELDALTTTILNAGIEASCKVTKAGFQWDYADSSRVADAALCDSSDAEAFTSDKLVADFTVFRYWDDSTKLHHATEDAVFQALKEKGTTFWGILRKTAKEWNEPWAVGDEYMVIESLTDNPQDPRDAGGYIKKRIPQAPQRGMSGVVVAGA